MKYETVFTFFTFYSILDAAPVPRKTALHIREVPQEHSHNTFLDSVRTSLAKSNPDSIHDPVFGLLGNAAAAAGQGSISDTDCLHQATADQAFTNAKAAGDVVGMTDALIYAALERNTGKVGLASVACTAIKAKNPEIAAISQHQDPASPNAATINKAVTIALAKQIASVGGDPQQALKSGTFAPGTIGDPTAKGNSCDTADDEPGCIFTQSLLVEDATADEINAAIGSTGTSSADSAITASTTAAVASNVADQISASASVPSSLSASSAAVDCGEVTSASTGPAATASSSSSTSITTTSNSNIQSFTGSLGGPPPPVSSSANSDRPFTVNGATFVNSGAALQRSCSIQHNACANAANAGTLSGGVAQCETQEAACNAAASSSKIRAKRAALDFGSCTDPSIKFADGLDGRKEPAFAPVNEADFNHGSALNIGVISSFICGQLGSKCKAGTDTTTACASAEKAASAATGQAAADAFNAALGLRDAATVSGSSANATKIGTCPSTVAGTSSASASVTVAAAPASLSTANASAAGINIQNFTGSLGGPPPPVLKSSGARPFSVNGDTFVNSGAALQRSCSVQHNACANAANSGMIVRGVGQCETQEGACNAANKVAGL